MSEQAIREESFKDYYLILQIHPEADPGMIDAAYWHLARRYNELADGDPHAKEKLDELNEAYSVLGTPDRHAEYTRQRNETLGEGALPQAPKPRREPAPLAVLERQQPRSREEPVESPHRLDVSIEQFVEPSWQNTLLVLISLIAATVALLIWNSTIIVLLLLVLAMLISAAPIMRLISRTSVVASLMDEPERTTHLRHLGSKRN